MAKSKGCNCLKKVDEILERHPADKTSLIMVMQDINKELRYLPEEALSRVSEKLAVPLSKVYSVATFYKVFSLKPKGKKLIKVCMGTACHIKGAPVLLEKIENDLRIKSGETTKDLEYTVETVNCVGACALAPLVAVNEKYHGNLKPNRVSSILKGKKSNET